MVLSEQNLEHDRIYFSYLLCPLSFALQASQMKNDVNRHRAGLGHKTHFLAAGAIPFTSILRKR